VKCARRFEKRRAKTSDKLEKRAAGSDRASPSRSLLSTLILCSPGFRQPAHCQPIACRLCKIQRLGVRFVTALLRRFGPAYDCLQVAIPAWTTAKISSALLCSVP